MRLLEISDSGQVSFTGDLENDIPPYAILSHTWGSDDQEIKFDDIRGQTGQTKNGYKKIDFCQKQATKDGLRYFWIDSCCINQDSTAELSKAIISMFRWYHDATKCYVYLSDVSTGFNGSISTWEESLRRSRWFTRGWTLQELIAPRVVEFFSSEGQLLGDKVSLEQQLHGITKIPVSALRGTLLSKFSIEERMSWSQNRETKVPEDKAYCLFGIFGVYTNPLYGEGQGNAYRRLQKEVKSLREQPFSTVPFSRDPNFIDRPEILEWLHKKCDEQSTRVALIGIGGIGKSQAVIEYTYQVRDNRPQTWVFWSENGSIIVTFRYRDAVLKIVGDNWNVKPMKALEKNQALQLLQQKLHITSEDDDMAKLLDALDYIPLAITQAAANINRRPRVTVLSYLNEFRESEHRGRRLLDRDLGDLRRDGSASNSVKTTWYMSFESFRKNHPLLICCLS
ncbi:hypothetical protein M426DRAFT_11524 [Hypoxylon sp. CI-4A]|nr:hypothetical protein M426DRAFT_11524 [Hypoxylon sp. CI-4A]